MPQNPATQPPARGPGKIAYLFSKSFQEWNEDKCSTLGAALAYYTVFSLAPLVLVLLAVFGMVFGSSEVARQKITEQLRYLVDPSAVKVIQDIAANTARPNASGVAAAIGILVALFGASGVFGQLQDALNTIWGVKLKPGRGFWHFIRSRFLSFAMVAGISFLLLVSLTIESILNAFSSYLKASFPAGDVVALCVFVLFDLTIIVFLFAMIFRYLPDVELKWRDVLIGAGLTALFFYAGKFVLGLYLGSGVAGSAYGAASSLITLLLWVFYSAQIVLFGAEFTQVYANTYGSHVRPSADAVRVKRQEIELDTPHSST
ncbi:MAG: YihY/virulence factor BrkB family protein [Verrucomicrobia bacterium]|nr:YihY/virulence factor BrkB family protein [Verrucomicrobiota bacterium]